MRDDLTPDELRRLLETAAATPSRELSSEALGRRFGIGQNTVLRLLKDHGVKRPAAWRKPGNR